MQFYVGAPAGNGEPPRQLKHFQRVALNPGQAQTVSFTVTARDLAYWNTTTSAWTTPAGTYPIMVGNSSRNLPLTGSLPVPAQLAGSGELVLPNPHGMSSPLGRPVSFSLGSGLMFTATGLPAGISLGPDGQVSGAAAVRGTTTVTVTGRNTAGATGTVAFVWTVT